MASILRQIVAGPRVKHPEANLDLCYVTDYSPSSSYPQRAYRNPTDALVRWLDDQHGPNWAIWEFRAEGTGYPDDEVYGRIRHYPWPDHHPPPFALIPLIMASMRNWLHDKVEQLPGTDANDKRNKRVVVVHCKAGKGRSGTVATSYLISQEGWNMQDALQRFTQRRMRLGFGSGVSIPSQLRWVRYVDIWTRTGKRYVERPVEIVEIHVWGLREGVKMAVAGYIEEGRKIKTLHIFTRDERLIVESSDQEHLGPRPGSTSAEDAAETSSETAAPKSLPNVVHAIPRDPHQATEDRAGSETGGRAVIFKPQSRTIVPHSDVCIDLERRSRAAYGWTMVTAVAHVWFNVGFEGAKIEELATTNGPRKTSGSASDAADPSAAPEAAANAKSSQSAATDASAAAQDSTIPDPPQRTTPPEPSASMTLADSGVFEIEWDALDGLKGSARKGTRALDRLAVVWRIPSADAIAESTSSPTGHAKTASPTAHPSTERDSTSDSPKASPAPPPLPYRVIVEPAPGEPVPESMPADWQGETDEGAPDNSIKNLGLRQETPASANVSKANSIIGSDDEGVSADAAIDSHGTDDHHDHGHTLNSNFPHGQPSPAAGVETSKSSSQHDAASRKARPGERVTTDPNLTAGVEDDSDDSLRGVRTHGMEERANVMRREMNKVDSSQ